MSNVNGQKTINFSDANAYVAGKMRSQAKRVLTEKSGEMRFA